MMWSPYPRALSRRSLTFLVATNSLRNVRVPSHSAISQKKTPEATVMGQGCPRIFFPEQANRELLPVVERDGVDRMVLTGASQASACTQITRGACYSADPVSAGLGA